VRDLGTKNGTWIGEARAPSDRDVVWKPVRMMKIGRTVLALEEPLCDTLASIEAVPDEALAPEDVAAPPPAPHQGDASSETSTGGFVPLEGGPSAALAAIPDANAAAGPRRRSGWSATDILVMAAALGVLGLSLAGLVWLLRG
jgi:hypothetical protein